MAESNKCKVLIVEDEALIRMNTVDMIRDLGFEVIEAVDADEAVSLLESVAGIEVVFTDIQMPGSMDGLLLAAVVRDRWPPSPFSSPQAGNALRSPTCPQARGLFQSPIRVSSSASSYTRLPDDVGPREIPAEGGAYTGPEGCQNNSRMHVQILSVR